MGYTLPFHWQQWLNAASDFSFVAPIRVIKRIATQHVELTVLMLFVVCIALYNSYEIRRTAAIVEAPQINDFFLVDYFELDPTSDGRFRYVPLRVMEITDQGIEFRVGNIAHTTPVSAAKHFQFDRALSLRNFYRVDRLFLPFDKIASLHQTGVIYAARRPTQIYIDGWMVMYQHEMRVDDNP